MPRKLILFSICILFCFGCSTIKIIDTEGIKEQSEVNASIIKTISLKSVTINRAQIEIEKEGRRETLISTVKYREGAWLLSVRSEDGIELVRLFVNNDTVLINDRINRKLYYGDNRNLAALYGFDNYDLSLLFGILQENVTDISKTDCIKGFVHFEGSKNGAIVSARYKCGSSYPEEVEMIYKGLDRGLKIKYLKYREINNLKFPELLNVKIESENLDIVMRLTGYKINEDIDINFVPGSNYEKVLIK